MPRFVCTSDTEVQTDFARGATIKYIIYLCQECGGHRQGYGRTEVDSFLLKGRERTLAAKPEVLEMLEDKEEMWFGGLEDDSRTHVVYKT